MWRENKSWDCSPIAPPHFPNPSMLCIFGACLKRALISETASFGYRDIRIAKCQDTKI